MPSLFPSSPFGPPRAPLQAWRLQVADARFGFAWYCGNGVIVTQAAVNHGTVEAAHAYHDLADRVITHRAEDLKTAGGLYVIHDLRLLETYDSDARKVWSERMRSRERGYLRGSTVVVKEVSPLLKMAVAGINMMTTLNLGSKVELSLDLTETLRQHRVQPPGPGDRFP
jgi:hypothetical protein